jgi:hypothetical protein
LEINNRGVLMAFFRFCMKGLRKPWTTSVWVRTGHLPNTGLEHYRCTSLPSIIHYHTPKRGCIIVLHLSVALQPLWFLERSRYFFIQVAPQLSSRGWVDPVPDPLLLRRSGRAGNRTRDLWICSQKVWSQDHGGRDTSHYCTSCPKIRRSPRRGLGFDRKGGERLW